jgi:hypothetical protein
MQIKKIKQVAKLKQTNSHKAMQQLKQTAHKNQYSQQMRRETPKTIGEMVAELKNLVKVLSNNLTVKNFLEHTEKNRVKRTKEQLKIYFLASFKKGVFKFVVKSSGLNEPSSYFVDLQFQDLEHTAITIQNNSVLLMENKISIQCSCDDFKYRFRYWHTKMNTIPDGGQREYRFPKITNANGENKLLCKHCVLVLNGVKKPSFKDNIFKRYINNIRTGKKGVRVKKEDSSKTLKASKSIKFKG